MKYLFIELKVQDGENRHTHRVLHTTNGTDIKFVAQLYASRYYGEDGELMNGWWNFQAGCMGVKVENVRELTEFEYQLMSDIFSSNVRKNYFEIVHAGFQNDLQREEIQIHAGENGNIYLIKTDEGMIVDVYGQNDLVDTLLIFEDEFDPTDPDEIDDIKILAGFDEEEVKAFRKQWGQKHTAICTNLGYEYSHNLSDELLMVDYFFLEVEKKWYPKISSMYTEKEQLIADYLRVVVNK